MENQLLYFKRGGSEQFKQGETPSQTLTLSAASFGDLTDLDKDRFTVKVSLGVDKTSSKINASHITASGVDTDDNGSNDTVLAGTIITIPDAALTDTGTGTLVIAAHGTTNGVTLEENDVVTVTFEPGLDDEIVYPADNLLSIRQDTSGQTELRFSGYQGADVVDVVTLYHTADKFAEVTTGVESMLNATKRTGVVSFDAQAGIFAVENVTALGINVAS